MRIKLEMMDYCDFLEQYGSDGAPQADAEAAAKLQAAQAEIEAERAALAAEKDHADAQAAKLAREKAALQQEKQAQAQARLAKAEQEAAAAFQFRSLYTRLLNKLKIKRTDSARNELLKLNSIHYNKS